MKSVREILVVEGKYDALRLSSVVEATVVETGGFRIFRDREKITRLRHMAKERGVIVLTDSDGAGLVIRNHLRSVLGEDICVRQAYIPPVQGKERRKAHASKEGLLGVEAMDGETLLAALQAAGATFDADAVSSSAAITKARLYEDGLTGGEGSAELRRRFLLLYGLPTYLSTGKLLEFINIALTEEEYIRAVAQIRET